MLMLPRHRLMVSQAFPSLRHTQPVCLLWAMCTPQPRPRILAQCGRGLKQHACQHDLQFTTISFAADVTCGRAYGQARRAVLCLSALPPHWSCQAWRGGATRVQRDGLPSLKTTRLSPPLRWQPAPLHCTCQGGTRCQGGTACGRLL